MIPMGSLIPVRLINLSYCPIHTVHSITSVYYWVMLAHACVSEVKVSRYVHGIQYTQLPNPLLYFNHSLLISYWDWQEFLHLCSALDGVKNPLIERNQGSVKTQSQTVHLS